MEILERVSPLVEPVSIDEAYLDVSGLERLFGPPEDIGHRVKQAVRKELGLTVSVGIGPNRLIAKLASDFRKPDGLTLVPPAGVQAFLDPMPVSALRGVGQRTLDRLERLGVRRVEQLRRYSLDDLQRHFGDKGGQHLYRQARGEASDRVGDGSPRRSISKETTFEQDLDDPQALHDTLLWLAAEVGWLARHKGLEGRVVTLKLRLAGFETHTRQRKLNAPTAADQRIFQSAWSLYQESGFTGRPVRLIGIGISGWDEGEPFQGDLFSPAEDHEREQRLYATLDRVGQRFGRGKLRVGLPKGGKRGEG